MSAPDTHVNRNIAPAAADVSIVVCPVSLATCSVISSDHSAALAICSPLNVAEVTTVNCLGARRLAAHRDDLVQLRLSRVRQESVGGRRQLRHAGAVNC